ncbi:MAG TPA: serine hydrolase domain-containing protein [Anaerolineales bacterium]|nr:serine hydrolase domain-containing protein [Anaerolineales bacterium]
MRPRQFAIFMIIGLGLIGPVQTIGARCCLDQDSPVPVVYADQSLAEDLLTLIPAEMRAANVPGLSIALIQAGKITWTEGFGETNTITGRKVAGDTVYEVASISKAVAAYAALRLVERGLLALDEPVHHYLSQPWLPPSATAEQITLRHLLAHTSGLTNQLNPLDKTIAFLPGERYLYSGVGYTYLQVLMEQVTGKSLEQIAEEMVFKPLQMDSSSYTNSPEILPRLSYGHIQYGVFLPPVAATLAVAFALSLLVGIVFQKLRLGKFSLSSKLLWVAYILAACLTLAFVIYILDGEINKWVTLAAFWLICFGTGLAFALWSGMKLIARLPGKWREPQNRMALTVLWSFTSALALLLITQGFSGPVPRSPAGYSAAAYSLRSTAPDLAKFLLELTYPQKLDPALMKMMTTPQVTVESNKSWGLGIGIQHSPQGTVFWHGGDNKDFHALMAIGLTIGDLTTGGLTTVAQAAIEPEPLNGVVILTNGQHGAALAREIAAYALGIELK